MAFVLDASLALSWHFEDEASPYADRVLERFLTETAVVPCLWPLEVANGLLSGERRGRLTRADVTRAVARTLELPVSAHAIPAAAALRGTLDLARAQRLTTYDAVYLHLAMLSGLPLASQDDDLRAAAGRVGVPLVA